MCVVKFSTKVNFPLRSKFNKVLILQKETRQLKMQIKQLQDKLEQERQSKYQALDEERQKNNEDMKEIKPMLLEIKECVKKPEKSQKIGAEGENFVLKWLKVCFPSSTIYRSEQPHCGDIIFHMEDHQKAIMFEVKNIESVKSIRSYNSGYDIKKFFRDSKTSKLGFKIAGKLLNLGAKRKGLLTLNG